MFNNDMLNIGAGISGKAELIEIVEKLSVYYYPEGVKIVGTEKAFKQMFSQYEQVVSFSNKITHCLGCPVEIIEGAFCETDKLFVVPHNKSLKIVYENSEIENFLIGAYTVLEEKKDTKRAKEKDISSWFDCLREDKK